MKTFTSVIAFIFMTTLLHAGSIYDIPVKDIDGKDTTLAAYKGKVVLIVNVASKCGFTPQYKNLEAVYKKYQDQGFVILGFPCNQFGGQEPGTDAEIKEFCTSKYDVTFPLFDKIEVNGANRHPLYVPSRARPRRSPATSPGISTNSSSARMEKSSTASLPKSRPIHRKRRRPSRPRWRRSNDESLRRTVCAAPGNSARLSRLKLPRVCKSCKDARKNLSQIAVQAFGIADGFTSSCP